MTDFEDTVRAVMRQHDAEAPTDLALPARRPERGLSWLPIAAAAAVVLIVVGITVALGSHRSGGPGTARNSDGTLVCPSSYDRSADNHEWVPAEPTVPGATTHLVPDRTPTTAVVCAYLSPARAVDAHSAQSLSGSRTLSGRLGTLTDSLRYFTTVQRGTSLVPCSPSLSVVAGDNYLLGLTYETGTLWVSAPGPNCESGSTNGRFRSSDNLTALVSTAYASGHWHPVPRGVDLLRIVQEGTGTRPVQRRTVGGDQADRIADAVNATFAAGHRGHSDDATAPVIREFRLEFQYFFGPDTWIIFDATGDIGVGREGTTDVTDVRGLTKLVDRALRGR